MDRIKILDCTLRDGGYANNWEFGNHSIKNILQKLVHANIDIIECGYLNAFAERTPESSVFTTLQQVKEVLPKNPINSKYVVMVDLGNYNAELLPLNNDGLIFGIRVCFSKEKLKAAITYSKEIISKGYEVFLQPMRTADYMDSELIELIQEANALDPYALYMVDSFGIMRQNDMLRLFYLMDNNLSKHVSLGFHAHNNMQMAFANTQVLLNIHTKRNMIVDASVFGMGRGAGNLNIELITEFANQNYQGKYKVQPLVQIMDEDLIVFYNKKYWGYSLPHYLSSVNNCHPNYASYLSEKGTLTIKALGDVLSRIKSEEKDQFNRNYIKKLYLDYQGTEIDDAGAISKLGNELKNRVLLLMAPGKSISDYHDKIKQFIELNAPFIISVNFYPTEFSPDGLFISNKKRYDRSIEQLGENKAKILLTSNIDKELENERDVMCFNYNNLLSPIDYEIRDNAMIMLINLILHYNIDEIYLAGMDGYRMDEDPYYETHLESISRKEVLVRQNMCIKSQLHATESKVKIQYLTPSCYQDS